MSAVSASNMVTDASVEGATSGRVGSHGRLKLAGRCTTRPILTVLIASMVSAGYHLWWIDRHRLQGGFDGDEAGYLASALRFSRVLHDDGAGAWARSALHLPRNGPLLPVLSSLTVQADRPILTAMLWQPLFLVVTAVAIAGITRRLAGDRAAIVAGVVVIGLPAAIHASRSYQLVPPVMAFLSLGVWALLASKRGQSTWHLAAAGAAVGAMVLSRTMAVTFLPGLFVAGLVLFERRRRTALNVVIGSAVAAIIAGPWWVSEWSRSIGPYLFRYGYGQGAEELGPSSPVLRLLIRLGLFMADVRPLFVIPTVVVAGLAVAHVVRVLRGPRALVAMWALVARFREPIAVAAVVVTGWVALLSSSNMGTWFQLPLEALAIPVVVAAGAALAGRRRYLRRLGVAVVCVAVANVILQSNWGIGATVRTGDGNLSMVAFGGVEMSQAIDFKAGDERFAPAASQRSREAAMRAWAASANEVAAAVDDVAPPGLPVMQTFFGDIRLLQITQIDLAEELTSKGRHPWEAPSARSTIGDGHVPLEPTWAGRTRILIAVRSARRDPQEGFSPEPVLTQAFAQGWVIARSVPLPDGGTVAVLTHPSNARP